MALVDVTKPTANIWQLTLNDPATMNALSFKLVSELYAALEKANNDNGCEIVILTGAGKGFCSGMNLEDVGVPPGSEGLPLSRLAIEAMEYMSNLVPTLRALRQPVIMAINGPAHGGGFCLTLGGDIRLASGTARFRAAGISNGLSGVELGTSYLLPRLIGASQSNEFILTGKEIGPEEAYRIGLVSEMVQPDLLAGRAVELAKQICKYSTYGVQMTKKVLWSALEVNSLEAAIDLENRNQLLVRMTTKNLEEAIVARKEKREPVYKD